MIAVFPKALEYLQLQNKWTRFSVASPQKVQELDCLIPILYRKSLLVIRLVCRSLNWESLNFVPLVHQNGNEYVLSWLTVSFPIESSTNHLPWRLSGVEAFFSMRRW